MLCYFLTEVIIYIEKYTNITENITKTTNEFYRFKEKIQQLDINPYSSVLAEHIIFQILQILIAKINIYIDKTEIMRYYSKLLKDFNKCEEKYHVHGLSFLM